MMDRVRRERLKFYLLMLLIASSLLQVGILWNYQNQRLPFNFFMGFWGRQHSPSFDSFEKARKELFIPQEIIVSEGFEKTRWMPERDSAVFDRLWKDASFYVEKVLKTGKYVKLKNDQWIDLIDRKAVIFKFNTNFKLDLLDEFFENPGLPTNGPSGVYKLIISPWDDAANYNSNTIYIADDNSIYKYVVSIDPKDKERLSKDDYDEIINKLKESKSLNQYSMIKNFGKNNFMGFNEDNLCVISGNKYKEFTGFKCVPLDGFTGSMDNSAVAERVLGVDKDSYDQSNTNNAIEFKALNSIFKVYSNGVLEYNYLTTPTMTDKGGVRDAFKNAFDFIDKFNLETEDTTLYLSNIIDDGNVTYKFVFNYIVDGTPVYINFHTSGGDEKTINNAITIEANSKNVLECTALLRGFEKIGGKEKFDIDFNDFLNDTVTKYREFKDNKNLTGKDIRISYAITGNTLDKDLVPVWRITTPKRDYVVPIRKN